MVGPMRPRTVPNHSIFSFRLLVTGKPGTLKGAVSPKCPREHVPFTAAAVVRRLGTAPAHTAFVLPFSSEPWMSASRPNTHLSRCQLWPIWPPPVTPLRSNLAVVAATIPPNTESLKASVVDERPQL